MGHWIKVESYESFNIDYCCDVLNHIELMVINFDGRNRGGHGEVRINVKLEFITLMLSYVFALPSIIYQ